MTSIQLIFLEESYFKEKLKLIWFSFGKKKNQNLKSSYLPYFMEKKSWYLKCKLKYGFSKVLCKKKQFFFDFKQIEKSFEKSFLLLITFPLYILWIKIDKLFSWQCLVLDLIASQERASKHKLPLIFNTLIQSQL